MFIGEAAAVDKCSIIRYNQGNGSGTGKLFLGHWGDALTSGTGISVIKGGNVGIGNSAPAALLDVNGAIRSGYDSDTLSYFGRTAIGSKSSYGDQAYFGHLDMINAGDYGEYAIVQNAVGETFINSASGRRLYFRIGNSTAKTLDSSGTFGSSDDRLKTNEQKITNAIETVMKLSPQTYQKYLTMDCSGDFGIQSGFVAQDIWYNAPELRHLVYAGHDASGNKTTPLELPDGVQTLEEIQNDPDYTALGWGDTEVGVDYEQIIAYLTASIQEQQTIIETEKTKTAALETQVAELLTRLTTLENAN